MNRQLSMLDLLEPPPVKVAPAAYVPREKREVMTRAYGREKILCIDSEAPDPVEVEIRGIPTLIVWDYGPSIYALTPPGTMFWSGTGFWSLAGHPGDVHELMGMIVTREPEPWWPLYVCGWRQHVEWTLRADGYVEPPQVTERQAKALAQMRVHGIDPNNVGPPKGFKGKWPKFEATA